MHRCVSKAVSCLSLSLHSHAIVRARTAWSPIAPLRLSCGNLLPICSSRGLRNQYTTPALGMTSSTETLSGTGGQMLIGKADAYEGFLVSPQDLPSSSADFDSQLQNSLLVRTCTSLHLQQFVHSILHAVSVGLAKQRYQRSLDQHTSREV